MRRLRPEHLRELVRPSSWWRFLERQLIEFARDSRRDPEEFKLPRWRRYGLEIAFGVAILAFFATTFAPTLAFQLNRWFTKSPTVAFAESRWIVLTEQGPEDACGTIASSECYGHPHNRKLWSSTRRLSDADHQAIVKPLQGRKFWVGIEISGEEARIAYAKRAGIFEMGIFNASYRIFLNGVLAGEGIGREYIPSMVQIPLELLRSGRPIFVAVEIDHDLESRTPAWLGSNGLSGLFDFDSADAYRGYWIFLTGFRIFAFAMLSILRSVSFGSLWLSSPKKTEYFYFGLFLFIFFLIQLMEFGPVKHATARSLRYTSDFWLRVAEGIAGGLLGIAYARVRQVYFAFVLLISGVVATLGFLRSEDHIALHNFSASLAQTYVPLMMLIGAFFCFAQAMLIAKEKPRLMSEQSRSQRTNRLITFSLLLGACSLVYFSQAQGILSTTELGIWYRPIQLTLLMLVGAFIFSDYKDRERVFDITQRSPFHDPYGGSANHVFGYLLSLDLKRSSVLLNYGAQSDSPLRATTTWNSLVGRILMGNNGFKVADDGDGLKAFFEGEPSRELLEEILACIYQASIETKRLERKLKQDGIIPETATMQFRAGLVWGGLNPIWKDFIGTKTAEWEDAKGYTTFKDVQRVMDFEKTRAEFSDKSMLLVPSNLGKFQSVYSVTTMKCDVKDIGQMSIEFIELPNDQAALKAA